MDQVTPTYQPPPSPNRGSKRYFFETSFIIVFLAVLLLVLNYLNIFKLSQTFPAYLGWLPQMKYEQSQLASPSEKEQPDLQAKQGLARLLQTMLPPSFAPKSSSDIIIFQGKTAREESRASWETRDGNQSARFVSSADGNKIIQLYILFDYNSNASVSADLARETVPQFFLPVPKEPFSCKPLSNKANYCEIFWVESDGTKRGIGMHEYSPFSSGTNKTTVFFCQFTQESKSYPWKSCAKEFSETGIR